MTVWRTILHITVTAFFGVVGYSLPLHAQDKVPSLLETLKDATQEQSLRLDRQIKAEWSKSGSASMNLLLRRGNEALDAGETDAAIDHFRALTDHAPEFAEGWHGLARAYFAVKLYGPTVDALGETLQRNPHHYEALYGLGVMFQAFGRYYKAEKAYRDALALHPHHERAKEGLDSLKRHGVGHAL